MKYRTRTDAIVIHCTATPFGRVENVESIRKMHLARGFADIGYHFLIGLDGEKWDGRRPLGREGAHVKEANSTTLGVSYVGGLGPDGKAFDTRTPAQIAALIAVIKPLLLLYPRAVILGHRDLSPDMDGDGIVEKQEWVKECPCFDAGVWAKSVGLPGARFSVGKYVRL